MALFREPVVMVLLKLQAVKTGGTCKLTHLLSGDTVAVNTVIPPDVWLCCMPSPSPAFLPPHWESAAGWLRTVRRHLLIISL